jgi:2'-5' RNA ligase
MPPFDVQPDDLPKIEEHLLEASALHHVFGIHLRGTGTFRPVSPVVFVSLAAGISACEELAFSVRRGPLAVDPRFPYHPHVTVAQDIDDAALDSAYDGLAGFVARFEVTSFVLFSRGDDMRWTWHGEFALGG